MFYIGRWRVCHSSVFFGECISMHFHLFISLLFQTSIFVGRPVRDLLRMIINLIHFRRVLRKGEPKAPAEDVLQHCFLCQGKKLYFLNVLVHVTHCFQWQ